MPYLGRGGLLRRVTPNTYHLYDENERHVGTLQRTGGEPEGWYGMSHPNLFEGAPLVTGAHPSKYHAGHDLMGKVYLKEHPDE